MMPHESQMLNDYDEGKKLANIALAKLRKDDIVHRGFLRPLEIALKTRTTETTHPSPSQMSPQHHQFLPDDENPNKTLPNSLPYGLRIAVKHSICDNRFTLKDLTVIDDADPYETLKQNNQDNILSLMKTSHGIELAICVCMYSEDKKMLKGTLAGIGENIANLAVRSGVDPDRIGVFVIMDGIEKVDPSVVEYFEELQRSSGINLGENLPPPLTIDEISQRAGAISEQQINEQEFKNVNNFLFNPAELKDRNERSFPTVKAQYQQIRQLLATVQALKKKKPHFDDLPAKARPFFFNEARLLKKKLGHLTEQQTALISEDRLIDQFALDLRRARPLIIKALHQCERHCYEYMQSRDDLAYLGSFRSKIRVNLRGDKQNEEEEQTSLAASGTERKLLEERLPSQLRISTNLFLCVKYKNSGKLSSHNWFFNGLCRQLLPKYAVLLDVGLKPDGQALFKMYNYMKANPKVGGVCGYMSLKIQQLQEEQQNKLDNVDFLSKICLKVADIQRTQQVQYHFAHLMDKGFEAAFGFIHVLPGAFSAYNMAAILDYNSPNDDNLLRAYFKSIDQKLANTKVFPSQLTLSTVLGRVLIPQYINRFFSQVHPQSQEQMLYNQNIYLAQDRILCMGIHRKGFDIKFLPDAYAEVDPIKTVHGLLGQRKRWINGSFFAFQRVKTQLGKHEQREGVDTCLNLQILYLTLMNSLAYFAPAFFLFTVHISMDSFRADVLTALFAGLVGDPNNSPTLLSFVYFMDFVYVMLVGSILYYSLHLTNGNKHFKPYIYAISTLFGLFAISVFLVLAVDVFRGLIDNSQFLMKNQALVEDVPGGMETINAMRWVLIASTLIFALPVVSYVILFQKFHIAFEVVMGAFSFLFYGPTYLNILNIYALCRIDDISWGTKGLDAAGGKNNLLKQKWYLLKMVQVGKFLLWNTILGIILLSVGSGYKPRFFITLIMVSVMAFTLAIKIVVSLGYMICYKLTSACGEEHLICAQKIAAARNSRLDNLFQLYSEQVLEEVRAYLLQLAQCYNSNTKNNLPHNVRSFLQFVHSQSILDVCRWRQKQQFAQRSQLSHQLSYLQGLTQKKASNTSNNFSVRLLNQHNLPIQTRKALQILEDLEKRQSAMSLDNKISHLSLNNHISQFSLDKRPSYESIDRRNSPFQLQKRSSQPFLEKKSSAEVVEKRISKADLENKDAIQRSIPQEQQENLQMEKRRTDDMIVPEKQEIINEENESDEHSMQYLEPAVVQIKPKRKLDVPAVSRFKPDQNT